MRDCRCGCGSLLARLRGDGVELKCRRCKRVITVALAGLPARVEGHTHTAGSRVARHAVTQRPVATSPAPEQRSSEDREGEMRRAWALAVVFVGLLGVTPV